MIFHIYSALLYVFSIFFFPYMAVKMAVMGKSRAGLRQRFGLFDRGFFYARGEKTVWVHAVSVGETLAAVPLVKALKDRRPGLQVYFSTVTETGNAVAKQNLGDAAKVFFFPFDFPFSVKRTVGLARPDVFIVVETEIWPNLIRTLASGGVPALMVNGRISPRSFKGYMRARFFMRRVLSLMAHLNMQTAADAERIKALGAPAERVSVVGNVKFDQACRPAGEAGRDIFTKAKLGIPEGSVVMLAGSTHTGEEAEVLEAYRKLLESYSDAFLIIAPRHPERLDEVKSLVERSGYKYRLRSSLRGEKLAGPGIVILDTMGELAALYRVGDINFVGGSLVQVGGHNVLEPVAFGRPVFFGPHMHNFAEIAGILKDRGVGIEVRDGHELAREAVRLISEPERLESLGRAAKETLLKNRGALDRNIDLIERFLG